MELSAEIVDCIQLFNIFAKHFILGVSKGYEYASNKAKQNPSASSLTSQKRRTAITANFFHFQVQYYLHITLWWDIINHKFNTRVFDFKLIHPCSWIHMILISHYLPVQTHRNNYRPTFSNFFGEKKFKVNYTVLF